MFHEPDGPWQLANADDEADHTVRLAASGSLIERLREAWRGRQWLTPLIIFVVSFAIFAGFAAERVPKQSTDPHFVYLANTFNSMIAAAIGDEEAQSRRAKREPFELEKYPPHRNDWASYWEIELRSGEVVRGTWLDKQGRGRFKLLGTDQAMIIKRSELRGSKKKRRYFVSFPPGPAVLMMPLAAISGYDANDVIFTLFFAALNVVLMFILLRRMSRGGRTGRGRREVLWLTALFGFGSVHLWCAVLGQVWFTALIVGATFTLLYLLCAIDARHPFWAGVFLAMAFATRTPLLFTCIFFYAFLLFPGGSFRKEGWGEAAKKFALFSVPCIVVGCSLLWMNHLRFGTLTEFGHTYLAGGTLGRIKSYGLFNFHFLSKNLSALFTLVPRLQPDEPFIVVSKHGMSILLTTPAFVWLAWPLPRENRYDVFWHRLLWTTVVVTAIPALLYQNTGYEQFGYRFSLDYTPYFVLLLAVGRRPLSWAFKGAVLAGVAVNAFGAVTFKRFGQFFTNDFFREDQMGADRDRCAELLRRAQQTGEPCKPLTDVFELGERDAYEIQQLNIERRLDDGARRVGWKVGLTSDAIQEWLGVDEPDYGTLLDDMSVADGGHAETSRLLQPRAEAEIAFVLRGDLAGPGVTTAHVLAATDFVLPAIEIIDSRVADWKIKWADTVADNASSGMFVVGSTPVDPRGLDLRLAGMALRKNGRVVSTGVGAACLGHPVNAVAWLANKLGAMGAKLSAGDVVLSGALGPVTEVEVGDAVEAEIAGLGSVRCCFA